MGQNDRIVNEWLKHTNENGLLVAFMVVIDPKTKAMQTLAVDDLPPETLGKLFQQMADAHKSGVVKIEDKRKKS